MPILERSSSWKVKPPLGITLDTSHPLSQALVGAWLFNEGGGISLTNYANNQKHAISLGSTGGTWTARSLNFKSASPASGGTFIQVDQITPTNRLTVIVRASQAALLGGYVRVFSKENSFEIFHDGGTSIMKAQIFIGGTARLQNIELDTNMTAGRLYDFGMTWANQSGFLRAYIDGKLNAAVGFQTGTLDAGLGSPWIGRHNSGTTFNWGGEIVHAFCWLRELSGTEMKDMTVDPYQMFIEYTPKLTLWFDAPATAPVANNATFPFQILQKVTSDASFGLQIIEKIVTSDASFPLEILAKISADGSAPMEILAKISGDAVFPLQNQAIEVGANAVFPLQIMTRQISDASFPLENLTKVSSDVTFSLQIETKVTADVILPLQIQLKAISDGVFPLQIISSTSAVQSDAIFNLQIMQKITSDGSMPLENLNKILATAILPIEILTHPTSDASFPIEIVSKVSADAVLPLEIILKAISDATLPIQIQAQIRSDVILPLEILRKIVSDGSMPLMIGTSIVTVVMDKPGLRKVTLKTAALSGVTLKTAALTKVTLKTAQIANPNLN